MLERRPDELDRPLSGLRDLRVLAHVESRRLRLAARAPIGRFRLIVVRTAVTAGAAIGGWKAARPAIRCFLSHCSD